MDIQKISNPGGIESTPQGWEDRFMPFPRVTPGLLEVNAAGNDMQFSFNKILKPCFV
jgi:hypothetical protein